MDRHEITLTKTYSTFKDWEENGEGEIELTVEFRKGYSGTKGLTLTAEEFQAVEWALEVDPLKYSDPTQDEPSEILVLGFPGEDAGDHLASALRELDHPCAAAVLAKI